MCQIVALKDTPVPCSSVQATILSTKLTCYVLAHLAEVAYLMIRLLFRYSSISSKPSDAESDTDEEEVDKMRVIFIIL